MIISSLPRSAGYQTLPYREFDKALFSVYVIDHSWKYLYINDFVKSNLGARGHDLEGKNMWTTFPELVNDATFRKLRITTEENLDSEFIALSPLTAQKLLIRGRVLSDCYLFSSAILPQKTDVIREIRETLNRRKLSSLSGSF